MKSEKKVRELKVNSKKISGINGHDNMKHGQKGLIRDVISDWKKVITI